jgi:tRNA threonylcarbamoyl adenosine modification protein (Sua5/YciO/YrdC/YwlC family)
MITKIFDCSIEDERDAGIEDAAAAIRRSELVVLPTDTVYGVAADAFSPTAIDALLAAKGRDRTMPVPVLVSSPEMLDALVDQMPDSAAALTEKYWPGALTLVMRHTGHLVWDLGESRGTVAVRMPDNEVAQELITRTGPLGVSSANRSGHPAATSMLEARMQLGAAVAVYLDGGPSAVAMASSIVDLTGEHPRLLRSGAIEPEELKELLPDLELDW